MQLINAEPKIVDPPGKMLAGLQMAGGVAVALVLGGIE